MNRTTERAGGAWDRRATLALIALVAACLVSTIWLVHPWYEAGGDTNDASIYLACAKSLLAGDGYSFLGQPFRMRPPGFAVLIAPILAWRGNDFLALNTLMALFGVLCVGGWFAYYRASLGTALALIAAAALWLNPTFGTLCNRVMSDVPGTALLVVGLCLARWAERAHSTRRDVAVGVFVGLSAYVRTVDVVIAPAIVCARLAARWRAGERGGWLRFAASRCAVPLLVPFLVLLPWSIRDALHPPQLPIDQTFGYSYGVALLHTDGSDPGSPLVPPGEMLARVTGNCRDIVEALGTRMTESRTSPASLALSAFIALGALIAAWRRRGVDDFVLLASLAAFSISIHVLQRYVLPIYVLALPAALDTLHWLGARAFGQRIARASLCAAMAALIAVDFEPRRGWDEVRERHARMQATCNELAAALPPDARLATATGWHFAVYLDRPVYSLLPRLKRTQSEKTIYEIVDRYGLNTIFCSDEIALDDGIAMVVRDRFGPAQRVRELEVWRVRR